MLTKLWNLLMVEHPLLIQKLEKVGRYKYYKKGEQYINHDEYINSIDFLLEGIVKVYHNTKEGKEIVHLITDTFGDLLLPLDFNIDKENYADAEVVTLSNTIVYSIDLIDFQRISKEYPELSCIIENARKEYGKRYLTLLNYIRELKGYDLFLHYVIDHANIATQVTQGDLASFLGLNVRNITEYKTRLKKEYPELHALFRNNSKRIIIEEKTLIESYNRNVCTRT